MAVRGYGGVVITTVLGAPGSGKTTLIPLVTDLLPGHVVLDWDAFMVPAAALAGREIQSSPATWPAYRQLVRSVTEQIAHLPVVVLGVSMPAELEGWPVGAWVLLDYSDEERRWRLAIRDQLGETEAAISDAREYRSLGLPTIDTTGLAPETAARYPSGLRAVPAVRNHRPLRADWHMSALIPCLQIAVIRRAPGHELAGMRSARDRAVPLLTA